MSVFLTAGCVPSVFASDLDLAHSGRRQLVLARCHAKLWPLSVQSHHRGSEGKVKRTATSEARYVVFKNDLRLQIFKT